MEYLPFGELMVDEHQNSNNTPYKFNGKELDDETGNYYYGARYYNPKFSIWLSVDPLTEKYPSHSPYNYTLNNPVNLVDPYGRAPEGNEWPPKWLADLSNYFSGAGRSIDRMNSQGTISDEVLENRDRDRLISGLSGANQAINDNTNVKIDVSIAAENEMTGITNEFGYSGEWTLLDGLRTAKSGITTSFGNNDVGFGTDGKAEAKGLSKHLGGQDDTDISYSTNTPFAGAYLSYGTDGDGDIQVDIIGRIVLFQGGSTTTLDSGGNVTSSTMSIGLGVFDKRKFGHIKITTKASVMGNIKYKKND